jgi:hypothetical protein
MKELLFVVGMHRSGTSCLTGLLGDAGVWLGPVEKGSPHNSKGNNENRHVMNLNKAVLVANGSSWDDPPETPLVWGPEHVARADELIAELVVEGRITAMKDPRTLFTGPGWRERAEAAGTTIKYIGTYRGPERVVASLTARDPEMDPALCRRLWVKYNQRLIALHDEFAFPIVDFDLAPHDYLSAVRTAFIELGLAPPGTLDFFENDLRHQETMDALDPIADAIYRDLNARSAAV